MTNENTARVIITFLQSRVHTDQSMVTTMWRCLHQCSVYHEVQDLVTTVVCTVYLNDCAKQSVQEWPDPPLSMLVMQYIQRCMGKGMARDY